MSRARPDSALSRVEVGWGDRKKVGRDGVGVSEAPLSQHTAPPPKSILLQQNDGILHIAAAELRCRSPPRLLIIWGEAF